MRHFILVILVSLLGGMLLFPLERGIRFRHLGIDDGLSQCFASAILQDKDGYIWFGTEEGLNRYDGYHFKIYHHDPHNRDSLGNNTVTELHQDASGIIWVGTSKGLNRFDPATETFTRYDYDPEKPDGLGGNRIGCITSDSFGCIWIGTRRGVNRFDPRSGKWRLYAPAGESEPEYKNAVLTIWVAENGQIWLGTNGLGLVRLDPESGKCTGFLPEPGTAETGTIETRPVITAIYRSPTDPFVLWLGTNRGPWKFDLRKKEYALLDADREPVFGIHCVISDICSTDGGKTLWIGTYYSGLFNYDPIKKTLVNFLSDPARPDTLSDNLVSDLMVDRTGLLWIATMSMVDIFDSRLLRFGHRRVSRDRLAPRGHGTWGVCRDKKGVVWIGSNDGLYRWDPESDVCEPYELKNDARMGAGRPMKTVAHTIMEDDRERLWVGSSGHGLYRLAPDRENYARVSLDFQRPNGKKYKARVIDALHQDPEGFIWVGARRGLFRIDPRDDSRRYYYLIPGQEGEQDRKMVAIIDIADSRGGNLWFGSIYGLCLYRREMESFKIWKKIENDNNSLSSNNIRCVYEDELGIVWIGTDGGGLNRFDPVSGEFKHYHKREGLPSATVYGILPDNQGYLWLSTNKGLTRFDPIRETMRHYDSRDGLQADEFNKNGFFRCADGQLIFGGIDGINMFYPRLIRDNPHVPPLVMNSFKILNQPVEIGNGSPLRRSIGTTRELVLSHRDYVFSFEFSALDFTAPTKNRYKYKLEGLGDEWIDLGNKHDISFSTLPPGDFTLRIMGSNNDGVWNEDGISLRITITPPFWQTWWFRSLLVMLAVSIVFCWHRKIMQLQELRLKTEAAISQMFERFKFSDREREITQLIFKGKSNKEIEDELFLSIKTVKNYLTNIYKKVGVKSRGELQSLLHKSLEIE